MIANRQQLQTALERITWCQDQAAQLRKTSPNRKSYLAVASEFLAEIQHLQPEVRDYLSALRASRGFDLDLKDTIELVREVMPASQAKVLVEHLLPSCRIVTHDDTSIDTCATASHFGGVPSMPRGMEWPLWDKHDYLTEDIKRFESRFQEAPQSTWLRDVALRMRRELSNPIVPLLFLAQLSLSEIHSSAPLQDWPAEGSLAFFFEPTAPGYDPLSRGGCQVFYFSKEADLVPLPHPEGLSSKGRFPHRRLSFRPEWTLPTRIDLDGDHLSVWGNEAYASLCKALMPTANEREPVHRCGGNPQQIQQDMRLECQLVSNGLYCGDQTGYQDPRRPTLEKGAEDWRLLIQIDSDEKRLGWMWDDVGRIYIWARWQDIKAKDFERSWGILQSY